MEFLYYVLGENLRCLAAKMASISSVQSIELDAQQIESRSLLFLTRVLPLGEVDGNKGHVIPGIVDADEQQQQRCCGDDE